jgi:hypothetical protein
MTTQRYGFTPNPTTNTRRTQRAHPSSSLGVPVRGGGGGAGVAVGLGARSRKTPPRTIIIGPLFLPENNFPEKASHQKTPPSSRIGLQLFPLHNVSITKEL